MSDDRPDERPRAEVWKSIHRELGLDPSLEADPLTCDVPTAEEATPAPVPIGPRRRRRAWVPIAIAAAVVVAVIVGFAVGSRPWDRVPSPEQVATAVLEPFPGWQGDGHAHVEETSDGHRYIVVTLADQPPAGQLREVWLMRSDLKGLVSLGLLDGDTGRFRIPAELDLGTYDVVDVSAEPNDGNPAHSGDSIVRGTLTPV